MLENNKPILTQKSEIQIGNITYIVNTHFKENGRETAEKKMLRYVVNCISKEIGNNECLADKGQTHSL